MPRTVLLRDWLKRFYSRQYPDQEFILEPASADASFRRYFRVTLPDGTTRIIMDAPPEHEDCRPFLKVAAVFRAAGVHVPEVHAEDLTQGFLLLSDLGKSTYLSVLDTATAPPAISTCQRGAGRHPACQPTRRSTRIRSCLAQPRTRSLPGLVCRTPSGPHARRPAAGNAAFGIRQDSRQQPRAGAGFRSSRLPFAQPNALRRRLSGQPRINRLSGRGLWTDFLRPRLALPATPTSPGKKSRNLISSSATGNERAVPDCRYRPTSTIFTAITNGWERNARSRSLASLPVSATGTARTPTCRTCRACCSICAEPVSATLNCGRWHALLDQLENRHADVAYTF